MKRRLKSILFATLFLLWTALSSNLTASEVREEPFLAGAIKEFEKFVKYQMTLDKAPGLSVGLIKGNFTWAKGFGFSDLENSVPAKPESSYRLASITKTITAIAVLQLVEEGKIDLDSEVQAYVPNFPKKKWPVTIRLILGHLGGISHYINYAVEGSIKVHKNTKEALAIFQDFDLVAEPGTKYNYSSYGYNLLGAVVEGASGQSYGQYIKKHIFEPLDMKDSRLDNPAALIPSRVKGYRLMDGNIRNSEYIDVSSRFAAGGTRSTVVDLLKYARGIMDRKLLKKQTWKQMFTSMATRDGLFTGYGMGWRVQPWRGHFLVSHGGSQPETRTHLLIFPTEEFAIAIASNLERLNLMPYVKRLAEFVLDEDLDSLIYVSDKTGQAIYNSCASMFSFGMSRFNWHEVHIAKDERDLAKAFSYFHKHFDEKALRKNFKEGRKKINKGFHPASDQALIKIGTFMASVLKENLGEEILQSYHKSGPLAFFNDYIKISKKWPPSQRKYTFNESFEKLISRWEKEWSSAYTDFVRKLNITVNTDFNELEPKLKKIFSSRTLYPDFSIDIAQAGRHYLRKKDYQNSLKIYMLCSELYPNSPSALSNLAAAYIWAGNADKARKLFKRAFVLDPEHPGVSLNQFSSISRQLENSKKVKEIFALADIALKLYPKNAKLHMNVGTAYLKHGQKEKARDCFKKALEIDPKLEDAKRQIERLKKEKKKIKRSPNRGWAFLNP